MSVLEHPVVGPDDVRPSYVERRDVQSPEAMRADVARLRHLLESQGDSTGEVARLVQERLDYLRNLVAAMTLSEVPVVWERYGRVVADLAAGRLTSAVLTKEDLGKLLGLRDN